MEEKSRGRSDFVREEKAKAGIATEVQAEPKLAAEIVTAKIDGSVQQASGAADGGVGHAQGISMSTGIAPEPDLTALKPRQGMAIARMNKFTQKVQEFGV